MVTPLLAPAGTSLVGLAALHLFTPNPPSFAPELQSAQIHLFTISVGCVRAGQGSTGRVTGEGLGARLQP